MKINDPRISVLINRDYTTIRVTDNDAAICFLELHLTPEQLSAALSRLGDTKCEKGEVFNLDKLNKRMEHKNLEFPMPKNAGSGDKEAAAKAALKHCPEGWESDQYFGSQGSFFSKDEKQWAQTQIRRWVEIED